MVDGGYHTFLSNQSKDAANGCLEEELNFFCAHDEKISYFRLVLKIKVVYLQQTTRV